MIIDKYSFGTGDRFGKQGKAQLEAMRKSRASGIEIAIVWNKSHREHTIIGTSPADVRTEADEAIKALDWSGNYYVDADHIGLKTVDGFLPSSDFFTLDVADFIGEKAEQSEIDQFVKSCSKYIGELAVPGLSAPISVTEEKLRYIAETYLLAVKEAGKIYRHIEAEKGADNFVTEVSMDETKDPQTPDEMLFILAAIAAEGIPVQTIAPKFSGRFNKGVDYVGDLAQFEEEFNADLSVISYAVKEFGLPSNLKLSVHSGSDKFSIYPIIKKALKAHNAGLHLKTAGTTWLEELIGLAEAGGTGLEIAKDIYSESLKKFDELCGPYASVIDIDKSKLPSAEEVAGWSSTQYVEALRHDQSCAAYNLNVRQLLHVGYKVAANMGDRYLNALAEHEESVGRNVTANLLDRHINKIFPA